MIKLLCTALLCGALAGEVKAGNPVKRTIGEMAIHTGTPRIPVILVQFPDKVMSEDEPKAGYASRLSASATPDEVERGDGTAAQYFADQSNGKFMPEFVVLGPVSLEHPAAYYGADGVGGTDENVGTMIAEAIGKAVASGEAEDWKDFDNDHDGTVDALYVIYAGEGQHALPAQTDLIWPHTATLADRQIVSPEADGVKFNSYSCTNELLNGRLDGIGTFCHEFSHQLGLPDFYRTDGVIVSEFAMGAWSLMDYGSYALDGRRPVGLRALEKIYLGWAEPVTLAQATTVKGWASTDTGAQPLKVVNARSAAEYYLLETIDGKGWNKSCPSNGLLVTHVCLNGMEAWNNNTLNNGNPYAVSVIAADNERPMLVTGVNDEEYAENLKGDTYPSPDGNDELTDTSLPASTVQIGLSGLMKKPITHIVYDEATGTVSFDFMGGSEENILTGIRPVRTDKGNVQYFRLDGTRADNTVRPGIYLYRNSDGRVRKFLKK